MYQNLIKNILTDLNSKADPRHVEAWIRIEHPTLDHLTQKDFRKEVPVALECLEANGLDRSEELATSMGIGGWKLSLKLIRERKATI